MYVAILKNGNKIKLWGVRHVETGDKGDLWIYMGNGVVYHAKNASILEAFVDSEKLDSSDIKLNHKSTLELLEA